MCKGQGDAHPFPMAKASYLRSVGLWCVNLHGSLCQALIYLVKRLQSYPIASKGTEI